VIELVPYDPSWPVRFREARTRIAAALPSAQIHHVGSTSIPGLISKPTIDILLCLPGGTASQEAVDALEPLGYESRPESFIGSQERHLFFRRVVAGRRLEHVHVVDADSDLAQDYLAFRDYLRAHPTEVEKYAAAKLRLLDNSHGDRAQYVDNKIIVVDAIMVAARKWYADQDH
jgi:GrpB-like predicted nucleotidyltransferase (UPF0157 family)